MIAVPVSVWMALGILLVSLLFVLIWATSVNEDSSPPEQKDSPSRYRRCPYCGAILEPKEGEDLQKCPVCDSYL